MGSSNRHWPSMFKSKPCNSNSHHHYYQWQHHDVINSSLISSACHRTPYKPVPGSCEEIRTPEPKPRWNPRPEQIRILESIFNSGIVNPPRDEIRKIRVQLQEYGQVGDANVFYWFQNRKSRTKHKQQRHLKPQRTTAPPSKTIAPSTSSFSSNKSSPNSAEKLFSHLKNSPTGSVNQPLFSGSIGFLPDPLLLSQGFYFPDVVGVADQNVENSPSFLLSELMLMSHGESKNTAPNTHVNTVVPQSLPVPNSTSYIFQGVGDLGPTKSTVFINDVCFEVGVGPFNVREAFGYEAVLIHSSGQPVLTNEWGVTMQPLQHGAFYYLIRTFAPSPDNRTILI